MNKLASLPRGFGAFPVLEVLDLTYNNLTENGLPGNFFMIGQMARLLGLCLEGILVRLGETFWHCSSSVIRCVTRYKSVLLGSRAAWRLGFSCNDGLGSTTLPYDFLWRILLFPSCAYCLLLHHQYHCHQLIVVSS